MPENAGLSGRRGPLHGIRILAISQFGAGPFATLNLADLGAEVIKIEDPTVGGDVARSVPPGAGDGDSLYFQAFNRGKKSIAIDLRKPEGVSVFHRLVEKSDAVFNNLRGDLPDRLGLTYERLRHLNPAIVTCSLSGFGRTGPRASEPGFDAIMQGLAGYMSITGEPGGPPGKAGVSIIDFAGGYAAALGLVAALLEAKSTGVGRDVDVSLLDTAVSMLAHLAAWQLNSDWQPARAAGSAHQSLVPAQNFQTSDGWIVVFCAKEHFWRNLAELLDAQGREPSLPKLTSDERFATFADRYKNRDVLIPILSDRLRQKTTQEWLELFRGKVPSGPVNTIEQALDDEQVRARGLVVDVEHPVYGTIRQVASSIVTEGSNQALTPGPALGEHTDELLSDLLSLSESEIGRLRDRGAIG
ncbi:MAG: CoA transferase [Chloroflexi bacterium]|nr:CoA transferase [Chloroflexota bacterium]